MMKTVKILAAGLITLSLCAALTACGGNSAESTPPSGNRDTMVKTEHADDVITIGGLEQNTVEADAHMHQVERRSLWSDKRDFISFPSLNTQLMELSADRVDALVMPIGVAKYLATKNSNLLYVDTIVAEHYHMGALKENVALTQELSEAIDALKANGTLDKLVSEYITDASGDPAVNTLTKNEGGETHKVAITGDLPPLDYIAADGTPAGFNVALLNAIAAKTGCNFELIQMEAGARLSALESGKVDFIFWMQCMGDEEYEPKPEVLFLTTPYFEGTRCFVTYSADTAEALKASME